MTTLPPITFKEWPVPTGDVDMEEHGALVKWIFPLDNRHGLTAKLAEQRALAEGAWAAIKDANSNQHRSLAKALEPLHEHLFTLRHWTGLQKLAAVKAMVQQALEEQPRRKIVVFAMCRDPIVWLKQQLLSAKAVHLFPGMDPDRKRKNLKKFNSVYKYRLMVCDIEAAVPPVDLAGGSLVIFLEQHFNPGVNSAALMRVHHAGQKNPVEVRCVSLAESSYDRRLTRELLRGLQKFVGDYEKSVVEITTDDIIELPLGENRT